MCPPETHLDLVALSRGRCRHLAPLCIPRCGSRFLGCCWNPDPYHTSQSKSCFCCRRNTAFGVISRGSPWKQRVGGGSAVPGEPWEGLRVGAVPHQDTKEVPAPPPASPSLPGCSPQHPNIPRHSGPVGPHLPAGIFTLSLRSGAAATASLHAHLPPVQSLRDHPGPPAFYGPFSIAAPHQLHLSRPVHGSDGDTGV